MKRYENLSGKSGVEAYQTGADYIIVKFASGDKYKYTYRSAGKRHIEKMKKLAEAGKGLSTYISQHIREKFESVLH